MQILNKCKIANLITNFIFSLILLYFFFVFVYSLTRDDFTKIAALIIQIFPTELTELYYKKAENGLAASGKLFNSYHNQRTALARIKEITLRPKTKKQKGKILNNLYF